jgi:Fe-S cluster biosynthesis and repair protein YggX
MDLEHAQGLADEYWERNQCMLVQEGEKQAVADPRQRERLKKIIGDKVDSASALKRK